MKVKTNAEKEWLRSLAAGRSRDVEVHEIPRRETEALQPEKEPEKKSRRGFGDVAGMDELKQLVTEGFINILNNRECAKAFGITPPSLLFYGPAGCGKTYFAEKIAEEVGINFIKVVPDDLASTLVHGTQEKIGEVFRKAEMSAPTLIFFDEFDAMVPRRTNDDRSYQNGETNEFLCMLNNASQKGVYVLAATNHPERIDKAVIWAPSCCSVASVSHKYTEQTTPCMPRAIFIWRMCHRQSRSKATRLQLVLTGASIQFVQKCSSFSSRFFFLSS